jgi:hypothetical protein
MLLAHSIHGYAIVCSSTAKYSIQQKNRYIVRCLGGGEGIGGGVWMKVRGSEKGGG